MFAPCEVAVKTISPAIRAFIAKILLEKHEMREQQVADMLGVTQSAISKYSKNVRGTTIPLDNIPEVQTIVNQMITILLTRPAEHTELMKLFCQACTIIRGKGLMCAICQQNQRPKVDNCDFCDKK